MKFKHFHWRKCIWKCCLENVGQFVSVSFSQCVNSVNQWNRKLIPSNVGTSMCIVSDHVCWCRYDDVIMRGMASQITSLPIVYLTVYSGTDQIKHQSFASLAFVQGIHQWPVVNSPHRWPVTRKKFPFVAVSMTYVKYSAGQEHTFRDILFLKSLKEYFISRNCHAIFFTPLAHCEGNLPVNTWIPSHGASDAENIQHATYQLP